MVGGLFGVVLVTVAALYAAGRDATETLVAPAEESVDLHAALTVSSVDVESGEMDIRLVPTAGDSGLVEGGVVARSFRILVNDVAGETAHTFEAGQPLRSIEFSVSLEGGSAFRYPFDRYDASVLVLAGEGTTGTGSPLRIDHSAVSAAPSYAVVADPDEDCAALGASCLTLEVRRPASTIGYAVWFIALVWSLALAGLGVLYVVVRRGLELPLWSFGYLVGVLFALPPLRNSLPTTPPVGGFVDFVAYYWAVAVVGVTLITLIALWIRENRHPAPGP